MRARSVVCGVDFSRGSAKALREAAAIATRNRGQLLVVFVEDPLLAAAASAARDRRGSAASAAAALKTFIVKSLGHAPRPRRMTAEVAKGRPADEVLRAAKRSRAGLVVLGTRGIGRAARFFLGSTTDGVLRRSRVPVLAVPL